MEDRVALGERGTSFDARTGYLRRSVSIVVLLLLRGFLEKLRS